MSTILVVEDDRQMGEMICRTVEAEHWKCLSAKDGNEALRLCEEHEVDAVVCDLIMPEKEGIETIVEMRQRWPGLPVLAISGGGMRPGEHYLEIARRIGVRETLAKPFEPDELVARLRSLLDSVGTDPA